MKVKKTFMYEGIELKIVEVEEPYLNALHTCRRCTAPNGKKLPINFGHRETLKRSVERTVEMLDGFKERGADIVKELTT
jgi:hypothetical protein